MSISHDEAEESLRRVARSASCEGCEIDADAQVVIDYIAQQRSAAPASGEDTDAQRHEETRGLVRDLTNALANKNSELASLRSDLAAVRAEFKTMTSLFTSCRDERDQLWKDIESLPEVEDALNRLAASRIASSTPAGKEAP